MERGRRRQSGATVWSVAVAVVCLQPATVLTPNNEVREHVAIDKVRLLFREDGLHRSLARPLEGADAFTPEDPECLRYGYEYRVHMPAVFAEPMCAVFYEDDLSRSEELLAELGFSRMVRFVVTPAAQAVENPPPEYTQGKRRISPQDYVKRGEEIERSVAAFKRQERRSVLDARLSRSVL